MAYHLVDIFKEINSTNSVKEKEAILKKHQDDEYLAEILHRNLNPHKLYQFNKMPLTYSEVSSFDKFTEQTVYKMFIKLLDDLEKRKYTGNDAKRQVRDVFCRMMPDEFDLYSKILLKKAIGVGASTVNKVWPDHIPEFKVMLAPNDLPELTKLKYPLYVQPKLDGYRCVVKDGMLWSREGKPFGNENLKDYFEDILSIQDYIMDGELYVHGGNFNSLQKILNTEDAPLPKGLKYTVYDCVPKKDWDRQLCNKPYSERLLKLREVVGNIGDYKKVIDIASDEIEDSSEIVPIYKKYLQAGYEGCMLKYKEGLYQWKRTTLRSAEMVKLKPFKTLDLEVTDTYEGEDKFQGTLGGVIVNFNGNAVRVGSGFDLATRNAVSKNKSSYIGKTAEIKFFEETEDGSLRFPIFIRWRDDK